MKKSLRILVSKDCNLACSYCCNEMPEVSSRIASVPFSVVQNEINNHGDICITGGEPLMFQHRDIVLQIISMTRGHKVYVYTNGLCVSDVDQRLDMIISLTDSFTIGLHAHLGERVVHSIIGDCVDRFLLGKCLFRIEDVHEKMMLPYVRYVRYETWKMNECTTNEDIILIGDSR